MTDEAQPVEGPIGFDHFDLDERLLRAVAKLGFEEPTPIQLATIVPVLEGRDIIGRARTGSGKTAAFGLPMLHRVREGGGVVRGLILAPTRELALQVTQALRSYALKMKPRIYAIYGGAPYDPQLRALHDGVDIVVGTPGRVLDLLERGSLDLSSVETFVLDEGDEMLRMGFIEDVDAILGATPDNRQVMLFSATMPQQMRAIAEAHLTDPLEIQVEDQALTVDHIEQRWMCVPERRKIDSLARVLRGEPRSTALVFCRTRRMCAQVADDLAGRGIGAEALHGDLNQGARERVLLRLRSGRLDVVVATDVASRGIDVQHITHVINVDLPSDIESYVHRIGRTARAGRKGVAISLVTPRERRRIREMQRRLNTPIKEIGIPSDATIGKQRRNRLIKQVLDTVEGGDLQHAWPIIDRLKSKGDGYDAATLAAGLLTVLAELEAVPLVDPPEEQKPRWSDGPKRTERDFQSSNEVEIFIPVGRAHGVRPGDLVGALANETGIPGARIGRVSIAERKSFIGLSRADAEVVLKEYGALEIRGVKCSLSLAKQRPNLRRPGRGNRRPGRRERESKKD
ncbi:MAG: DEAD/DEAH box helicase [Proteobacteria bacterium]|nr:DEAD/DEAH box helicase [Pseudomonadota bacterium]